MADERGIRRRFASEDKAEAVKRHVVGGETVSAICENLGIAPNLFYTWADHGQDAHATPITRELRLRSPFDDHTYHSLRASPDADAAYPPIWAGSHVLHTPFPLG